MNLLTKLQISFLQVVGASDLGEQYIWTGGTALAHRLLHRYSSDLDFFSEHLEAPEIFFKNEDIRVEFVYFPFSPLKQQVKDKEFGIRIDSVLDITVNKTLSAYQRREPKDAYDLYRLCKYEKYDLKKLTRLVEKKFGVAIDYTSLITKLIFTTEIIDSIMPILIHSEENLKKAIQEFFQSMGNRFLMSVLF